MARLRLVAHNPLVTPCASQAALSLVWSAPRPAEPELDAKERDLATRGKPGRAALLYYARVASPDISLARAKEIVKTFAAQKLASQIH